MDYGKIYKQLVERCKLRGLDKEVLEGYYEKHHILPKCLGGTDEDSNYVLLTPREHVIAHRLLWKDNPENYSLMWAYTRTVSSHKGILTSRQVESAKILKSEYMKNRVVTEETRAKISKTLTGHKRTPESVEKGRLKQIGQKRSKETKAKLKAARKDLLESGWTHSEESREKIGNASRGKKLSDETKYKIGLANIGKTISEDHKKILSNIKKQLKPWRRSAAVARSDRTKVWLDAEESHSLWVAEGMVGCYAFSGIVSALHGIEYSKWHFAKLVEMFAEGWIPCKDDDWLSFKEDYVR